MPLTTLQALVRLLQGSLERGSGEVLIRGIAAPEQAEPADVTVLFDSRALRAASDCRAAAVVLEGDVELDPACRASVLRVGDARAAFVTLLEYFHPVERPPLGVHPTAWVHPDARLGAGVSVGPLAAVEAGARIGDDSVLQAQSYVGADAQIGSGCTLEVGARVLARCEIGDESVVGPGSVVGGRGFGHLPPDASGRRQPIPQVGRVVVGRGVEIGALCAIDRGTLGATRIGDFARLDNLVQVGHNAAVSAGAVLVAQVGLSGSSRVGRGAVLAGQSGLAEHRSVGDGAVLVARAAAFRDVPAGAVYGGVPARPHKDWAAAHATLSRLSRRRRPSEENETDD